MKDLNQKNRRRYYWLRKNRQMRYGIVMHIITSVVVGVIAMLILRMCPISDNMQWYWTGVITMLYYGAMFPYSKRYERYYQRFHS